MNDEKVHVRVMINLDEDNEGMRRIMKKRSFLIAITFLLSAFVISGCGIGLTEMKKDQKNVIPMPVARPYIVTIEKTSLFLLIPNDPGNEMKMQSTPNTLEEVIQEARNTSAVKESDLQMAESITPYISMMKGRYGINKDQLVYIYGISYKSDEIEKQTGQPFVPDVNGALVNALSNMQQDLIKDMKTEGLVLPGRERPRYILEEATTSNGIKGKSIRGTCKLSFDNNASYRFKSVCFPYESDLWIVIVFTREPDSGFPYKTDSIIIPIEIEPKGLEYKFADGAGYKGEE